MEMHFRMFLCWSIKRYTLCHQKMLKSALKKKNATVADAITVICCSKSPPGFGGKRKVKVTKFVFLKIPALD